MNDSLGALTSRLVGFSVTIDTNALTEGQVLVSHLVDTIDGINYFDFRPEDKPSGGIWAPLATGDIVTPGIVFNADSAVVMVEIG